MTVAELIMYLEDSDPDGEVRLISTGDMYNPEITSFSVHDRSDFMVIQGTATPDDNDPENAVYIIEHRTFGNIKAVPKPIRDHMDV